MRVMVAMSGGVDSSVAAGLMVERGHEVIGLTMKLRDTTPEERGGQKGSCCSPDDLMDARVTCDALGIAHYVVDYRQVFKEAVIDPFAESYLRGRTPNPCINCNDNVKFAPLLERAKALNADLLVTGHYARVVDEGAGHFSLYRGRDRQKDQSYFLFGVSPEALSMTQFPLGDMEKEQVRVEAQRLGLPNWDKADSEDICFVPNGRYAEVVERLVGESRIPQPGPIIDQEGRRLGTHNGLHHYTIGQRRGLRLSSAERVYVVDIRPEDQTLVVGPVDALNVHGLRALRCRWGTEGAPERMRSVTTQIRYRHRGTPSTLMARGERAEVYFNTPQPAVTPGQAAVFYDGDKVIGGGWIETSIQEDTRPPSDAHLGESLDTSSPFLLA